MAASKKINTKIRCYFPEQSYQQLLAAEETKSWLENHFDELTEHVLKQDWQYEFCQQLGLSRTNIAWNKLRALSLGLDEQTPTFVCCDPVMMQMTHRGAYLWGQQALPFSKEDTIKIVAQINQQLMGEGERFYWLDNNHWLYSNKKPVELNQTSFENYIGKDMFSFHYAGNDGLFWDRLATEIQMLIKQMIDYQGVTASGPEMIANVHFWGNTQESLTTAFEKSKNEHLCVFSSSTLIELFANKSNIQFDHLNDYKKAYALVPKEQLFHHILVVAPNEVDKLVKMLAEQYSLTEKFPQHIQLITQDKLIQAKKPQTGWKKWLNAFNPSKRKKNQYIKHLKGSRH